MSKLRVLDLFSGIGGFSLGLERTGGFETVAFCEINPFCRKVLAKHWPDVPCFEDVTTLRGEDVGTVDVICGGFPCQDISRAGSGAGLSGARSGLWFEYARLIGELRPGIVLVENVSALLHRGLDAVLGSLAALGYDAEWHCIPAAAVGAPHIRDRLWIIANPQHTDANSVRSHRTAEHDWRVELQDEQGSLARPLGKDVADTGRSGSQRPKLVAFDRAVTFSREEWSAGPTSERGSLPNWRGWATEPDLGRVAHGVSDRAHRLKSLGNAVVPQIPELIGHAILESMRAAA